MRRTCGELVWPVVACALLLTCARAAADLPPGICQTTDVRNFPRDVRDLQKLRGCRVIEGQLNIVLLERATQKDFANISFPELREVTGYIMFYRMKGVRNLGDLFPNLSVVRGMQLFKDYAIVIFDSDIEMLGLRSLTTIERGAVRIQNNDKLCYSNSIDWSPIVQEKGIANIIRSNYDPRLCGLCPASDQRHTKGSKPKPCPADSSGRLLCWDDKHCQKLCPTSCNENACMEDGTCCHRECLGGCDGPGVHQCHVCRHFSIGDGTNRTCTKSCPAGFYELYRRCVSEQECRQMPPPPTIGPRPDVLQPHIQAYKIFNHTRCVWTCPSGYMESGDVSNGRCEPCPASGCLKECPGGLIDSISNADHFKGCTRINGNLEIYIRNTGSNMIAALELALGEVRVITGGLKVTRSTPLVSLMFLKNLERIEGRTEDNGTEKPISLYVFANANLELLWDWDHHKPVHISGKLYIHFNPKLCYGVVKYLKNITNIDFTDTDVSPENNGDQAPCFKEHLNLEVQYLNQSVAILKWDRYCTPDSRKLLGYSIYYIPTDQNVTLYGQRDACSDTWNVIDIKAKEVTINKTSDLERPNKTALLFRYSNSSCQHLQPEFYILNHLTPFTRYAAYVKTFTTHQDKEGAQSSIIYFKTLPERPSPPQSLSVESLDPQTVHMKWLPPALPNGTIYMYHIELQANSYNRETIIAGNANYCTNPNKLATLIAVRGEDALKKAEERPVDAGNGTCECRDEGAGVETRGTRFNSQVEEERQESIFFENELQNYVYIKTGKNKRPRVRSRRSADMSSLVILSSNTEPALGRNYTNSTEGGYVKSQYYELDGKTLFLTVSHLRHFTWYTVNVWACREKHVNETDSDYATNWCSKRAYYTFRTLEMPNADVVTNVHASVLPSNKTVPEVNVTWTPPPNPNGFVVAYNVHYIRMEENPQTQDVNLPKCITSAECRSNLCGTILRNLPHGNYSIKVTPVTPVSIAGTPNATAQAYVFIEERAAGHEWIWGLICGCVILLLVLGVGIWYAKREFLQPAEANKLFASVNPEYVSTVYVPDEWEVPRGNIELIRELGQGSFGMVYEGILKSTEKGKPETRCAVKTVNEHATDRERIEFLNEASVMKSFDTQHVVRLLGVVSRGQPTLVIMELMEQGDLKTYLRSHRPDADSSLPRKEPTPANTPPTLQNILQMAIEIADGMAYLSAKKFVHRDLAARNCMVAGDLTVKVGDFGMTRDIYETDYYRKGTKGLLPVRWMSPESLKDGVFSSNSDVWSYGVVLWEMATLAMQPYQGLSNEQVVRYVKEGGVMERPEHCPDRLYELMRLCWAHRPAQRPSFLSLVADLARHAAPHFRHRSFFHSPQGQELYALQRTAAEEEQDGAEVNVGAVATGSGSNLFGVSGRLASWVRELSSLRSRASDDAAAEPLQPPPALTPRAVPLKAPPNGALREPPPATTGC